MQELGNRKSNGIFIYKHVCLLFCKFVVCINTVIQRIFCNVGGLVAPRKGKLSSVPSVTEAL